MDAALLRTPELVKAARTVVIIALGAIVVAAALTALVATETRRQYEASQLCGGSPSPDCRQLEEATVTSIQPATQPLRIVVKVETDSGAHLQASISPNYRTSRLPAIGQRIEIEVWRGSVTKLQLPQQGMVRTYGPWT